MHGSFPKFVRLVVAGAVLAPLIPTAAAQTGDTGFLRGKGKLDIALTYGLDKSERVWVGDTKTDIGGKLYHYNYNLWAAYGLRDDLDLSFSTSVVRADVTGDSGIRDHQALTDGVFGAKWRFLDQKIAGGALSVAATPALKIPLYHYKATTITQLGDGQVDVRLRGVLQYTADCGAYVALESGYDVRFEGTPNEVPIALTVGATFFNRLTISPFWMTNYSFGDDDLGEDKAPDVEEEATRAGVGLYYRMTERFGATAGYKTTFQGRNTFDLWGYWVGLVIRI